MQSPSLQLIGVSTVMSYKSVINSHNAEIAIGSAGAARSDQIRNRQRPLLSLLSCLYDDLCNRFNVI